jgi:hypothetical protein
MINDLARVNGSEVASCRHKSNQVVVTNRRPIGHLLVVTSMAWSSSTTLRNAAMDG